ncbi:protein SHORT HYPOCOTYL IN WHITE LIGHT 1-like isoform X2 [Lotus japonicus]|uniref:protein SHORT HYPOCOTYL IN WHITE LIGHT 1-like isoform X2 n=1 Tax=Lotus japonicus TaxID=34305 RepID=UPI00258C8F88|nr:protein SHORT HYPOCOTYL IN WHITE LIGHT 1-like isoform X2 [Lotus japonicus]
MAGAAATAAAPFINLTRHPRSNLRHFSPNNVPCLRHQPFPSGFYHNHRSNPLISKVNSSIGGEPYEMDQAAFDGYGGIEEECDDDDAESSVDLLIRFLQSMFRKVSKRAKKASRSVLPGGVIPPQLVSFAVDGTLLLASLSVLKAFLELLTSSQVGIVSIKEEIPLVL